MPDLISEPVVAGAPVANDSPIVLVVDDDADTAEATANILRQEGVRVRTAVTTEYASDFCKTQSFDAVVLDHHLADGYTKELLDEAPEMGLAVLVSEPKPNLVADIHRSYGTREFVVLVKPVLPADLVEVVQETITESRLGQSGKGTAPDWFDAPTAVALRFHRWSLHCGRAANRTIWILQELEKDPFVLAVPEVPAADDLVQRISALAGRSTAEALVAGVAIHGMPVPRVKNEIKAPHHRWDARLGRRGGGEASSCRSVCQALSV